MGKALKQFVFFQSIRGLMWSMGFSYLEIWSPDGDDGEVKGFAMSSEEGYVNHAMEYNP